MRYRAMVMAALALGGCSMGQDMSSTDAAVADFHAKMNAGQFKAITDASGPEITGDGDFIGTLEAIHTKLGAFNSTSRQGFSDNINNGDHLFNANYASVYSSGPASENFVYRFVNGKPVLIGYHVQSKALLK